jgi:hypothetical protein
MMPQKSVTIQFPLLPRQKVYFVLTGKVKTGSITIGSVNAYDLPLSRNKKCTIKKIQLIPNNNMKIGNSKIKRAVF